MLLKRIVKRFFVLIRTWRGHNILRGRLSANYQKLTWLNLKVCNFCLPFFIVYQY